MPDGPPRLRPVDFDPFAPAATRPVRLPLTEPQREMWSAAAMGVEANCSYNQCYAFTLRGPLRLDSLRAALAQVVARHDGLRATIAPDGSAQVLRPAFAVELPLVDLSALDPASRRQQIAGLLERECHTPFDLAAGPLLRAWVAREAPLLHRFVLTAHHIVCDGWSSSVLLADLGRLYAADCAGLPARLPAAPSYQRYVEALGRPEHAEAARADEDYWAAQYPAAVPVLELPLERPRPPIKTYRSRRQELRLDGELGAAIRKTGARAGATLFATLLAAFEVLLHRLSGQPDLVVGIPFAGQLQLEEPALVAHCVHTVPLRAQLDPAAPFVDHLRAVRERLAGAQEHARLTFGSLLRRLVVPRDRSRTPLLAITFNIDRLGAPFDFGPLTIEALETPKAFSNFELMVNVVDGGADMRVECDYNADLFSAATIGRWLSHYRTLLGGIVARPDEPVEALPLLEAADWRIQLDEWNDTALALPEERRLHRLFEAQVGRSPDAEAVIDGRQRITYAELNARANRLAHRLRRSGVGPEVAVGVCLERHADLIVALLAVLKAGGLYVPLDPAYPRERNAFMLGDSRARALVTSAALGRELGDSAPVRILVDEQAAAIAAEPASDPEGGAAATDLAYVIYTSGSSGVPKGVAIEHRSAGTLVHWARTVFSDRQIAGVLASTSVCFDLSVFEIFFPLAFGGRIILVKNALEIGSAAAKGEITLLNTVPSAATELVRASAVPRSVETVCLAGEPLSTHLVDQLHATGHIQFVYDLYGPSEDTTYSTFALRRPGEPPTIGRPIANTQAYVLDARRQPVPIGVVGELYLAGDGLARGYLHREALTAERFVTLAFGDRPPRRAYRTGDLARHRGDGCLEFLGRADQQVKLRGFRIEPGEIEAVLVSQPGVREACVVLREDAPGDRRLVAYVVADGEAATLVGRLRAALRERLPEYMIPAHFVALAALPLLPNRKVDKKALPAPEPRAALPREASSAPRTPTEVRIAAIFAEVLGTAPAPGPGADDSFFDLGGHSLMAAQVMTAIRDSFGVDLGLRHLFEQPTVAGLAAMVDLAAVAGRAPAGEDAREEFEL